MSKPIIQQLREQLSKTLKIDCCSLAVMNKGLKFTDTENDHDYGITDAEAKDIRNWLCYLYGTPTAKEMTRLNSETCKRE